MLSHIPVYCNSVRIYEALTLTRHSDTGHTGFLEKLGHEMRRIQQLIVKRSNHKGVNPNLPKNKFMLVYISPKTTPYNTTVLKMLMFYTDLIRIN